MIKAALLRRGRGLTQVSGSLSGSGTLTIPAGVATITITARGGTGGNDYWYDPGQPYIAPTYSYSWSHTGTDGPVDSGVDLTSGANPGAPTSAGQSYTEVYCTGGGGTWFCYSSSYTSVATQTSPGQPYIAPSSGGGDYYGPSTTATFSGTTKTWTGGLGPVAGTQSVQTLSPNGAAGSMTYSVGSGGSMSYAYEY